MSKKISILGSTGSIGVQTLDVIRASDDIRVLGLTTNRNIDLLYRQVLEFKPLAVAVCDYDFLELFLKKIQNIDFELIVYGGLDGLVKIATLNDVDTVITAVVGSVGIVPTVAAIEKGKNIALANKETLVSAGNIVMRLAKENNVSIIPIDSEHSAILQCLHGKIDYVSRLIITASGGPFRGKTLAQLKDVSVSEALNHPNWNMGSKISIDSATLMNKGFEVIEAKWLFGMDLSNIDVIIHPQSIIHSMVEYIDGSVIAQLGVPDMHLPIQYALFYPERKISLNNKLDLLLNNSLTFEQPDINSFPCLRLAYEACALGGFMPAVLNAANEACVDLFLSSEISFVEISSIIETTLSAYTISKDLSIERLLAVDKWAKNFVYSLKGRG